MDGMVVDVVLARVSGRRVGQERLCMAVLVAGSSVIPHGEGKN